MKPFNLERALAGDAVVTQSGKPVPQICHLTAATQNSRPVVFVMDGEVYQCRLDGRYFTRDDEKCVLDLFMAAVRREGWVNVYRDPMCIVPGALAGCSGNIWATEDEARRRADSSGMQVRVEWEE
jgi:hypothetical protein